MDPIYIFEGECDLPTGMSPIPIFGDERNLPKAVAGLKLSGVQHYPDPALGVSVAFNGPGTRATVYLYNLGLSDVSTDLRSDQLHEVYQRSFADIEQQVERGAMTEFQLHASKYLHLPPDAPQPVGIWAAFSFIHPSDSVVDPSETDDTDARRQVSHLVVRADRGYFNKIRYTHPKDHGIEAANRFRAFVAEWTAIVQCVSTDPDREHPWIDYDEIARASDNDRSGVGRDAPGDFVYMRTKARRYIAVGPHLYRSTDAMGLPDPTLSSDQLDTLMRGVLQIFQWKGLTPETALRGIGTDGFDLLIDLFHYRVIDRSNSSPQGGNTLERVLVEHIVHGPERQVTLFNVT